MIEFYSLKKDIYKTDSNDIIAVRYTEKETFFGVDILPHIEPENLNKEHCKIITKKAIDSVTEEEHIYKIAFTKEVKKLIDIIADENKLNYEFLIEKYKDKSNQLEWRVDKLKESCNEIMEDNIKETQELKDNINELLSSKWELQRQVKEFKSKSLWKKLGLLFFK